MQESYSLLTFRLLTHTLTNTCTSSHSVQLPIVVWEGTGRFPARENLCFRMIRSEADGTISEAAAARPTAPSGAENQDNFIVIISLPLSPSLQLMEEERGEHKKGREGVTERVWGGGVEREAGAEGKQIQKEEICASWLVSCRIYECVCERVCVGVLCAYV